MIARPPSLREIAIAGPLIAETRRAGIADAAVLELSWTETPAVTASVPGTVAVHRPATAELPFVDGAAGAVLLLDPPREHAAELLHEACRSRARRGHRAGAAQDLQRPHSRRIVASGLARTRADRAR